MPTRLNCQHKGNVHLNVKHVINLTKAFTIFNHDELTKYQRDEKHLTRRCLLSRKILDCERSTINITDFPSVRRMFTNDIPLLDNWAARAASHSWTLTCAHVECSFEWAVGKCISMNGPLIIVSHPPSTGMHPVMDVLYYPPQSSNAINSRNSAGWSSSSASPLSRATTLEPFIDQPAGADEACRSVSRCEMIPEGDTASRTRLRDDFAAFVADKTQTAYAQTSSLSLSLSSRICTTTLTTWWSSEDDRYEVGGCIGTYTYKERQAWYIHRATDACWELRLVVDLVSSPDPFVRIMMSRWWIGELCSH